MGKGVTVRHSLQRKLVPDMQGQTHKPTSLRGIALSYKVGLRKRVSSRSPVRKNRTPGSVRGASGNRRSYRDGSVSEDQAIFSVMGPMCS